MKFGFNKSSQPDAAATAKEQRVTAAKDYADWLEGALKSGGRITELDNDELLVGRASFAVTNGTNKKPAAPAATDLLAELRTRESFRGAQAQLEEVIKLGTAASALRAEAEESLSDILHRDPLDDDRREALFKQAETKCGEIKSQQAGLLREVNDTFKTTAPAARKSPGLKPG